jgi:hypothetical protein
MKNSENNISTLYKGTDIFKNGYQYKVHLIKDKQKNYFNKLLNIHKANELRAYSTYLWTVSPRMQL